MKSNITYKRILKVLKEEIMDNTDLGIDLSSAQWETIAEVVAIEIAEILYETHNQFVSHIEQALAKIDVG